MKSRFSMLSPTTFACGTAVGAFLVAPGALRAQQEIEVPTAPEPAAAAEAESQSAAPPAEEPERAPQSAVQAPIPPAPPPPPKAVAESQPQRLEPADVGDVEAAPAPTASDISWFARPPLQFSVGEGDRELSLTFYGFLQTDFIYDTTRSYSDGIGSNLVARTDTYEGTVGRTQASTRNTRLGLAFESPRLGGVQPIAVFEGDFFGNQPSAPPDTSETNYYDSATFRLRHAYAILRNDAVDVLVGQTYDVFGWQNYFFPTSAEFLGLPHQVFSRHAQVRLSREFGASGPLGVDVALAALRPAQRDSRVPDANAGLRFKLNDFRGLSTSGNGGTRAQPLALGVSGVVRQYSVDAFTPPPTQDANEVTAWGLSVDALLPIIAAEDDCDRGNRLTLTGSFVTGTGIGDLITTTGGATFPTLPNPAQANPPPEYEGNIDPGLVSFDTQGVLHTIDWRAFRVGLVYYLPPTGRVFVSANYTQAYSKNLHDLFPQGGAEIELLTRVADRARYADINVFFDATPAVRLGLAGSYTVVEYIDGDEPHNIRVRGQAMYFF